MTGPWQRLRRSAKAGVLRRMPLMLTCREFEDFIADYLDGTLPHRQRMIFRLHLAICAECRAYLKAYQATVAVVGRVFDEPDGALPDTVPQDLVAAVLAARKD